MSENQTLENNAGLLYTIGKLEAHYTIFAMLSIVFKVMRSVSCKVTHVMVLNICLTDIPPILILMEFARDF